MKDSHLFTFLHTSCITRLRNSIVVVTVTKTIPKQQLSDHSENKENSSMGDKTNKILVVRRLGDKTQTISVGLSLLAAKIGWITRKKVVSKRDKKRQ